MVAVLQSLSFMTFVVSQTSQLFPPFEFVWGSLMLDRGYAFEAEIPQKRYYVLLSACKKHFTLTFCVSGS